MKNKMRAVSWVLLFAFSLQSSGFASPSTADYTPQLQKTIEILHLIHSPDSVEKQKQLKTQLSAFGRLGNDLYQSIQNQHQKHPELKLKTISAKWEIQDTQSIRLTWDTFSWILKIIDPDKLIFEINGKKHQINNLEKFISSEEDFNLQIEESDSKKTQSFFLKWFEIQSAWGEDSPNINEIYKFRTPVGKRAAVIVNYLLKVAGIIATLVFTGTQIQDPVSKILNRLDNEIEECKKQNENLKKQMREYMKLANPKTAEINAHDIVLNLKKQLENINQIIEKNIDCNNKKLITSDEKKLKTCDLASCSNEQMNLYNQILQITRNQTIYTIINNLKVVDLERIIESNPTQFSAPMRK